MTMRARDRILPPYTPRVADWRHALRRLFVVLLVIGFAAFYGMAIAVLPQQFMTMLLVPVALLLVLALWMAPDVDPRWDGAVIGIFFAYLFIGIVWPHYLAIDIVGLPWLPPSRFVQYAMVGIFLAFLAMSPRARREIGEVLPSEPLVWRLWLYFFILHVALMPLAGIERVGYGINFLIYHLLMLLIAVFVLRREGMPERLSRVLLYATLVLCIYGALEVWNQKPIWSDHIPSFLRIQNTELLERYAEGHTRALGAAGQGFEYRAKGPYSVSLFFGEYLGMLFPLAAHAFLRASTVWRKVALGALAMFVLANVGFANSRSGWIALIGATASYYLVWATNRYLLRRKANDLFSSTAFWAIPATFLFIASAVLFVGRIRAEVLGHSGMRESNNAREIQWDSAVARTLEQPWGYGPGRGGEVVNFRTLDGFLTIDASHAKFLPEYGFVGFALLILAYLASMFMLFRVSLHARGDTEALALPAFAAGMGFLATRYGIADTSNLYIVFLFLALGFVLSWKQQARAPHLRQTLSLADFVSLRLPGGRGVPEPASA